MQTSPAGRYIDILFEWLSDDDEERGPDSEHYLFNTVTEIDFKISYQEHDNYSADWFKTDCKTPSFYTKFKIPPGGQIVCVISPTPCTRSRVMMGHATCDSCLRVKGSLRVCNTCDTCELQLTGMLFISFNRHNPCTIIMKSHSPWQRQLSASVQLICLSFRAVGENTGHDQDSLDFFQFFIRKMGLKQSMFTARDTV